MRRLLTALAVTTLVAVSPVAMAAPCKDSHGKFVKCPPAKAVVTKSTTRCKDAKGRFTKCTTATTKKTVKPVRCKNAKGKFVKCGTPGAKAA